MKNSTKAAATAKNGLLPSRRDKILAACGAAAVLGLLLLVLNASLKRRAARKNRLWR